jgi:uncharacterized membrane protein (Fun14 family)
MKVWSMWVGLAAVAFMAGALVELFAPECTQPICWGGALPGLLIILSGVLVAITVSATLPALGTGIVVGALTGLAVSMGAGAASIFGSTPANNEPASISPIVLSVGLGAVLGFTGALVGTTARFLIRGLRHAG